MSAVTVSIPQTLDQLVQRAVQTQGFASKAELFRFAVIQFLGAEEDDEQQSEEDAAIKEGLCDYAAGRVFGPFSTVAEFKSALKRSKKRQGT